MFDHRLAALLGRTVEEMYTGVMPLPLSQSALLNWQRYWAVEPWGPWRDNLHAAILAREIRRPQLRKGATVNIEDFMVQAPAERRRGRTIKALGFLRAVSTKQVRKAKRKS